MDGLGCIQVSPDSDPYWLVFPELLQRVILSVCYHVFVIESVLDGEAYGEVLPRIKLGYFE